MSKTQKTQNMLILRFERTFRRNTTRPSMDVWGGEVGSDKKRKLFYVSDLNICSVCGHHVYARPPLNVFGPGVLDGWSHYGEPPPECFWTGRLWWMISLWRTPQDIFKLRIDSSPAVQTHVNDALKHILGETVFKALTFDRVTSGDEGHAPHTAFPIKGH